MASIAVSETSRAALRDSESAASRRQAAASGEARPNSATEIAPTKVSAMNRPNSISDTRSTGSSTASRSGSGKRPATCVSVAMRFVGAGRCRLPRAQNFSVK